MRFCGGLTVAKDQTPTQTPPSSAVQGEKIGRPAGTRKLMGKDKGRGIAYQLLLRVNQAQLGEN